MTSLLTIVNYVILLIYYLIMTLVNIDPNKTVGDHILALIIGKLTKL